MSREIRWFNSVVVDKVTKVRKMRERKETSFEDCEEGKKERLTEQEKK